MRFAKFNYGVDKYIYINVEKIVAVFEKDKKTCITLEDEASIYVNDSVETIIQELTKH